MFSTPGETWVSLHFAQGHSGHKQRKTNASQKLPLSTFFLLGMRFTFFMHTDSTNIKDSQITDQGPKINSYLLKTCCCGSEFSNHQCISLWFSKWKHCMSLKYLRHFVLICLSLFSLYFLFAIIPEIRLGRKQCLHILGSMRSFQDAVNFRDARKSNLVQWNSSTEDSTGSRMRRKHHANDRY